MPYQLLDDAPAAPVAALPPKGKYALLEDGAEPAATPRSFGEQVVRGVGRTVRAVVKGGTAIPNMVGDALGLKSTSATDRLMDMVGLPRPENWSERIAEDVGSAMTGQGGLAKLGSLVAKEAGPIVRGVGQLMARDPGIQVGSAAAAGGAGGAAREAGMSEGNQLGASLLASMAVPMAAQVMPRAGAVPGRIQDLWRASAEHDVPLSYSDITGKAKRLDTSLEYMPFLGTAKYREQGSVKATGAAERVVGGAKDELEQTGYRGMNRLKLAAQDGDKAAQRTLEQIQNAGDDWQKIMQASGNLKLWRARQDAESLYDRVEKLAQPRGNMPLQRTQLAIDDAIVAEQSSKLPDDKLLGTLNQLRDNLFGQGKVTDFSAARQLRSDLGDIVSNYYKGQNALVGAKGVDKLQSVRNAVETDMEQFATGAGGDLAKAWKRADEFYKTAVVPYKDKALARALSSDTPDEIYSQFIRTGRSGAGEDRAAKFYDALDAKGKAAVRYGMLSNAMDDAAIAGKDTISPAKFSASLEKIGPGTGVFFKGEDKAALDGFTNLMRHAERFGQYSENPPTGQRVIPMLSLLGAAAWPKIAAAIGGGALVAREVTTRPALRDALIRASNAKPGSIEMERLGEEVARQLPMATTTPRSTSQQQPAQ